MNMIQERIQKPVKRLRWSVVQKLFYILTKRSILDVWYGYEYAFVSHIKSQLISYTYLNHL